METQQNTSHDKLDMDFTTSSKGEKKKSQSRTSSFTSKIKNAFKSDQKKKKKDKKEKRQEDRNEIESHPKCLYCKSLYDKMNEGEINRKKYRIRRFLEGK